MKQLRKVVCLALILVMSASCLFGCGKGGGVYNSGVGNGQLVFEPFACNRAYRAAGGNYHFYIVFKQKMRVLKGISCNGFTAAVAVGHSARVAEVNYIFIWKNVQKFPYRTQSSKPGVKNSDGVS